MAAASAAPTKRPVSSISSASLRPDRARQGHARRRAEQPQIDPRDGEPGGVGAEREVAAGDQLAPGGHGRALHAGDHRLETGHDRLHQPRALGEQGFVSGLAAPAVPPVRPGRAPRRRCGRWRQARSRGPPDPPPTRPATAKSAAIIAADNALARPGSLSVRRPTAPSTRQSRMGSDIMDAAPTLCLRTVRRNRPAVKPTSAWLIAGASGSGRCSVRPRRRLLPAPAEPRHGRRAACRSKGRREDGRAADWWCWDGSGC